MVSENTAKFQPYELKIPLQRKDGIPLTRRRTKLKEVNNIHSAGDPKAAQEEIGL